MNPTDILTDPWGAWNEAFDPYGSLILLILFLAGVGLVYIKTQSIAPTTVVFILGSVILGSLLPANTYIQKLMFVFAALGIASMAFYMFQKRSYA